MELDDQDVRAVVYADGTLLGVLHLEEGVWGCGVVAV